MLNVVCINAGNYEGLGVQYVRTLNDMVRRNLPEGYPGRFIVFTDSPGDYGPDIEVRDLPAPWLSGWWTKLSLFKPGVFESGDRILYLDLDTLIAARLDAIAAYDGPFAILRDFYRLDGWQSSVMAWTPTQRTEAIWTDWIAAASPQIIGGDQAWIEQALSRPDLWQDICPGGFVSYKVSDGEPPSKAAIVVFHGHPRPHQVAQGWVPMIWKEGGISRAELDAVCNTATDQIHANIRSAIQRDLTWFDFDWTAHARHACIVGGGPSLKEEFQVLRRRRAHGQDIWALNGTANWLMSQGIVPDVQVILDARPENVAFVSHPRPEIHYLIGSQCDPAVFDALEGYDVTLFHCASEGVADILREDTTDKPIHLLGIGTTVALKAMILAELSGFRTLHLIGIDSCYMGDEHHAYEQAWNDGERRMEAIYGNRVFQCAPWMIGQAEDFIEYAGRFNGTITVAGDGLLAHIAREGVPETAADTRAREILARLPEGPVRGVEIGVFAAELSSRLLTAKPDLTLHMVDSWGDYDQSLGESGDFHATLAPQMQERYFEQACQAVSSFNGRAVIHRAKSVDAAREAPEGLDFAFIDADHSYEGCRADIDAWASKVKAGGYLCGHDYDNHDFPQWGVKRAVDEYVAAHALKLELGDNFTWFVRTKGH